MAENPAPEQQQTPQRDESVISKRSWVWITIGLAAWHTYVYTDLHGTIEKKDAEIQRLNDVSRNVYRDQTLTALELLQTERELNAASQRLLRGYYDSLRAAGAK